MQAALHLARDARGQFGLQEALHFRAEGFLFGSEIEVHLRSVANAVGVQSMRFKLAKSAPRATRSASSGDGFQNSGSSFANARISASTFARPIVSA